MDKTALFAACAPKVEEYPLPGGHVLHLRSLTLDEREALFKSTQGQQLGNAELAARWVIAACDDLDDDDAASVQAMDGKILQALSEKVMQLAGVSDDAVEEAEKN